MRLPEERKQNSILIVVGPTAVGKTEYAIALAEKLGGEIVSADSMQLYRYMNIGSAKPTEEERKRAVHHLVDEIDPREAFSVFSYQKRAKSAIFEILSRGKIPIVSGGTGLYVNSLIYDMDFSSSPGNEEFRKRLEEEAEEKGNQVLHDRLRALDPKAAERIHPNNRKKVIRALEMLQEGQEKVRSFEESFVKTQDYDYKIVGLTRNREELYDRINRRVDLLVEAGLENEVKGLLEMGLTEQDIAMKGIGYKELIGYFNGNMDFSSGIDLIKKNTRNYAKRQMTWFRRYEKIRWFDLSESTDQEKTLADILDYWKR